MNPWAGEVEVMLNGTRRVAKLTLGALAELEADMGEDSLPALVERFEAGGFSSRDVLALLLAGLRGGGWDGDAAQLRHADIGGGALHAATLAATLLTRGFAPPDAQ